MKLNIIITLLLTVSSILFSQDEKVFYQLDSTLSIKVIDSDVYLISHSFPWQANSLVIKSDGELLFIDTPYTDEAAEKVVNWLRNNSSFLKITVINTHFHIDNLGGNGYLEKSGANIYGSDLTVRLLEERGLGNGMLDVLKSLNDQSYYKYWLNTKLVPPNRIFSINEKQTIQFGKDDVEIYYPGGGHTPDNLVVYYAKKKILFGGCLIKSLSSTGKGNIADAVENEWFDSVKKVKERYSDVKIVIPGHGNIGDKSLLDHTLKILK